MTAPAPTSPWNIPLFDDSSPFDPIQDVFNAQSNALNTALSNIEKAVPDIASLPASGNWPGRHIYVTGDGIYVNPAGDATWVRTWSVGTPYAEAAGTGSNAAGAFGTITFPTGRFTQPPLLTFSIYSTPPGIMFVNSVTKDSASVAGLNTAGTAIATSFHWRAVQMTPTAAAG